MSQFLWSFGSILHQFLSGKQVDFQRSWKKEIENFCKILEKLLAMDLRPKSGTLSKEILLREFFFEFCEIFQNSCSIVEHLRTATSLT